jgi:hypothetical protein
LDFGPVIAAPKVVTITFPGDSIASSLATFGAQVTTSSYWSTISAGYCASSTDCVGAGTGTSVALSSTPASSYTDSEYGGPSTIQTFLSGLITNNLVPQPDDNTIYAIYFPQTPEAVTISLDGAQSCVDFDGYHLSMQVGTQQVFYAIIPECAAYETPTLLENTTVTASHELIEAATDPSLTVTTYYLNLADANTLGWNDVEGGEVADLCVDPFGLGQDLSTEGSYDVQRVWSIQRAAAGTNPCVPIPTGEVYFNAVPEYSVVVADVGQSVTMSLSVLADGPIDSITVLPEDWSVGTDGNAAQFLSYTIQGGTFTDGGPTIQATSGQKLSVTVTLTSDPTSATQEGWADGVIVTTDSAIEKDVTRAHFWPFIMMTPAVATDAGITMTTNKPLARSRVDRARALARARVRPGSWFGNGAPRSAR